MSIIVTCVPLGYMQANCYLVKDNCAALAVDPGSYDEQLLSALKRDGITELEYILLTHGHFDHILGAKRLQENFGGKIVIHKLDEICFTDTKRSLLKKNDSIYKLPTAADITVNDMDEISFGEHKIKVIHTPGHTPGSVCYLLCDAIFSGDTVFAGTIGRTDFYASSMEQMLMSIKKLSKIEGNYHLYPGHNEPSTLEYEKNNNPYFKLCNYR